MSGTLRRHGRPAELRKTLPRGEAGGWPVPSLGSRLLLHAPRDSVRNALPRHPEVLRRTSGRKQSLFRPEVLRSTSYTRRLGLSDPGGMGREGYALPCGTPLPVLFSGTSRRTGRRVRQPMPPVANRANFSGPCIRMTKGAASAKNRACLAWRVRIRAVRKQKKARQITWRAFYSVRSAVVGGDDP